MEHIDHVFFINLERRKDRLEQIQHELLSHEIYNFERFNAITHETHGAIGCTKSHYEVLKLARDRNYKNVLIFEDDFKFIVDTETFHNEVRQIFENNVDFDIMQFAYNIIKCNNIKNHQFLHNVTISHNASCYLVNNSCYDEFIELYERTIPLYEQNPEKWNIYINDVIWLNIMKKGKCYATKTRCGVQRFGWSDVNNEFVEHGC